MDLLTITKLAHKYKNIWEHPGKHYLCESETQNELNIPKNVCPRGTTRLFCSKKWVSYVILYFILYVAKMRIENDKFSIQEHLQTLGYKLYIYQKNTKYEFGKSSKLVYFQIRESPNKHISKEGNHPTLIRRK